MNVPYMYGGRSDGGGIFVLSGGGCSGDTGFGWPLDGRGVAGGGGVGRRCEGGGLSCDEAGVCEYKSKTWQENII